MTLKERIREIWCDEHFTGTRADAMRLAMAETAEQSQLFGMPEPIEPPVKDHPGQIYMELSISE